MAREREQQAKGPHCQQPLEEVSAATYYRQLGVHPAGWKWEEHPVRLECPHCDDEVKAIGMDKPVAADEPLLSLEEQAEARCAARSLYGGSTRSWVLHLLRTTARPVQPLDQTSGSSVEVLSPAVDAALEWIADHHRGWCVEQCKAALLEPFDPWWTQ